MGLGNGGVNWSFRVFTARAVLPSPAKKKMTRPSNVGVAFLTILAGLCEALHDPAVTSVLQSRGLSRREAESVQHRHQRLRKEALPLPELEASLSRLDALDLLPGQVAHLVRSHPLSAFEDADPARHRWCSYKASLWCSCNTGPADHLRPSLLPQLAADIPAFLALDCEFKPLRCALVDEDGIVRLDCLVTRSEAGTSNAPLPGILKCDAPQLRRVAVEEIQALLRTLLTSGTLLIAHTPTADLRALGLLDELEGHSGIVDIALLGPQTQTAHGPQAVSLKRMAKRHLGIDIQQQRGGSHGAKRHCAREDARVAMRLYQALGSPRDAREPHQESGQ